MKRTGRKKTGRPPKPALPRFWKKIMPRASSGCWEWIGPLYKRGYGAFTAEKQKAWKAHRYSWFVHFGPIPDGKIICHKCDNPICVRPEHLFIGTHLDNSGDMVSKGRHSFGVSHYCAKLTPEKVREIRTRSAAGERQSKLCREFGLTGGAMYCLLKRRSWKSVD